MDYKLVVVLQYDNITFQYELLHHAVLNNKLVVSLIIKRVVLRVSIIYKNRS